MDRRTAVKTMGALAVASVLPLGASQAGNWILDRVSEESTPHGVYRLLSGFYRPDASKDYIMVSLSVPLHAFDVEEQEALTLRMGVANYAYWEAYDEHPPPLFRGSDPDENRQYAEFIRWKDPGLLEALQT